MTSIIDKVRKLRALASSDNVNEAAAAARLAEKLIQEHAIAEVDIATAADEPTIKGETPIATWRRVPTWEGQLLAFLTRAYQCKGIYDRRAGTYHYVAFGRPSDLEMVRYQFAYYVSEINRLAMRHGKGMGRTWSNSFRMGAAFALGDALRLAKEEVRATSTSTALAVVDRREHAARTVMSQYYPSTRKRAQGGMNLDGNGYEQGKRAGSNLAPKAGALGIASGRLLGS